MARIITKESALKIAKKLEAEIETGGKAHDMAYVYHEGKMIANFGIRRGSQKDKGHDHIPRDLHVGPHDARMLAQCPLTRAGWLDILGEKGLL
ncbi:MAG: hypothetical protein HY298_19240 [Verrucomicrobia bacterium]|nr:hypothetical protein [Verrucomicrobiota bacterium]